MKHNKCPLPWILLIAALSGSSSLLLAQDNNLSGNSADISAYFDRVYGVDPGLVSGDFYYGPARGSISGHPFFLNENWKNGYVVCDGKKYTDLQLKYDIYLNRVILMYLSRDNSTTQIQMRSDLIDEFEMDGRKFTRFPGSSDTGKIVFCEMMATGSLSYMVTKAKELDITSGSALNQFEYTLNIKQYIMYDQQLTPLRGMRTVYRIFPDKKKIIRRYIIDNGLSPNGKNVEDRAKVIRFCNNLIDQGS